MTTHSIHIQVLVHLKTYRELIDCLAKNKIYSTRHGSLFSTAPAFESFCCRTSLHGHSREP